MDSQLLEVLLDDLFKFDQVVAAAHRYSGDYFISVKRTADGLSVCFQPKCVRTTTEGIERSFRNDLLDEALRASVAIRTKDIQQALVEAALSQAIAPAASNRP